MDILLKWRKNRTQDALVWIENSSIGSHIWTPLFQVGGAGKVRRCDLAWGGVSLGVYRPALPAVCSLYFLLAVWRCKLSVFHSRHHACHLLLYLSTIMDSSPSETRSQRKLSSLVAVSHGVHHSNSKITDDTEPRAGQQETQAVRRSLFLFIGWLWIWSRKIGAKIIIYSAVHKIGGVEQFCGRLCFK